MAAAAPVLRELESQEYPHVQGYYKLIEAKRPISDQYVAFCNALHGTADNPNRLYKYRMFANANGIMSLIPRLEAGGREVWDYMYKSVLRFVECSFVSGTPFTEMQDDCSNSQTTVSFRCPNTMIFTQVFPTGNVATITCKFKSTGMKATHVCNGVTTRRVWRRVAKFDAPDPVEATERATRRERRERGAPSESSVEDDQDDDEDSGAGESDDDDEDDPEILRRADSTSPTGEMSGDEFSSGANKSSHSPPKTPPPPPPSPCCFDK